MAKARCERSTPRGDESLSTLCKLWHRQNLAIEACGADDELSDRRADALAITERQIAHSRAETPAGLLAKLAVFEHHLLMTVRPEAPDCAAQLALSLVADIRRLLYRGLDVGEGIATVIR